MNKVKKAFYRAGCIAMQALYAVGRFFKKLWQHKQGRIGLIIVAFLALLAIFAPLIAPYDPYDVTQRADKGLLPSWEHLLGTSITTGQDIFSMVIYGTRSSLSIGLITGIVIAVLGSILGVAAGYLGGWVDTIIMRIVDVLLVIPTLPLVIVMTNVLGTSYVVIVIVFAAFGWTGLARVIRSQVMLIKNANYVKAAELAGASKWYIMWRHILPAVSNLLIMSTALTSAGIMVAEAGLSFLGLGNPEAISWGKMLADAQSSGAMLFGHWWSIIAPGVGIFLSVYSFMRIGLALEEILNPRMRKGSNMLKVFKHLNNTYLDEVFASMDDASKLKGEYEPAPAALADIALPASPAQAAAAQALAAAETAGAAAAGAGAMAVAAEAAAESASEKTAREEAFAAAEERAEAAFAEAAAEQAQQACEQAEAAAKQEEAPGANECADERGEER